MRKVFKRTISLAIVVLLVTIATYGTSVMAAGKTLSVTSALSDATPQIGDSFDYTLSIGNFVSVEGGVRSYKIAVNFDSAKLEVASIVSINTVANEFFHSAPAAGKLVLLYADIENGTSPLLAGEVAKITFTVKSGSAFGDTSISILESETSFIDSSSLVASPTTEQVGARTVLPDVIGASRTLSISNSAPAFGGLLVNTETKYITNVQPGTLIDSFVGKISNVSDVNLTGTINGKIATGTKLTFRNNGEQYQYTVVIYGDINSDSAINVLDIIAVRNHLTSRGALIGTAEKAAHISIGSSVNIIDLLVIKNHVLGNSQILQSIL